MKQFVSSKVLKKTLNVSHLKSLNTRDTIRTLNLYYHF